MRILKWVMIFSAIVLLAVSCYWTPPESARGGLQIAVTARGLVPPDHNGQLIRVEFFHPEDIGTTREGDEIASRYFFPTSGASVLIDGQPWFEVPIGDENSGEITVPEIPVGTYRLRLGSWWHSDYGEYNPYPDYEGLSDDLVEITGGGTAVASVTLRDTFYDPYAS